MAEVIALGASIIAICQIADRIIGLCKFYIEMVHDAPSDLRKILVEMSALKAILQDLEFLKGCDSKLSAILENMASGDGAIGACRQAIADMEKLFPQDFLDTRESTDRASKKMKINYKATLTALAWPLRASKAMKLLQDISMHKTTIALALTANSLHDIKDIKERTTEIRDILTETQRHEVFKWLEATDPSTLHYRACKQDEPGTGDWMLRSPEWKDWIECKNRCLWIHGIPGAGKTVLASYLIEKIKDHCKALPGKRCAHIYYYCYFGHNQDEATPFLRWIMNRLCRESDAVPSRIYDMFKHGGTPNLIDLMDALESMLSANFDTVYITIDAIDESLPRADLLKLLRDLATDARFGKTQLLATSRQYLDIERVMEEISVEISMSNPLVGEDIRMYVQSQLHTLPNFKRWPPELIVEAEEALMSKAKGMFRWAVCQIDVLQRLKPRSSSILNALANLPRTLDETYERIFLGIPDEDRLFVYHVLKWIYYYGDGRTVYYKCDIPCSILLYAAERSTSHLSNIRKDFLYDEEALRELCGCLIVITTEELFWSTNTNTNTPTVAFAHYTVLEVLRSTRIFNSPVAFFGIEKENTAIEFTRITLIEALNAGSNTLGRKKYNGNHNDVAQTLARDFNSYCIASAVLSVSSWLTHLHDQDDLVALVFQLMNPLEPHFESLCNSLYAMQSSLLVFSDNDVPCGGVFWTMKWVVPPTDINSAILLGLGGINATNFFSSKLVNKVNIETLLEEEVVLVTRLNIDDIDKDRSYWIKGSIMDVIAQCIRFTTDLENVFHSLLDCEGRHLNTSTTLLSYICSHVELYHDHSTCGNTCSLIKLLQLGALPNAPRYRVKPLQIAAVRWDFEGVKTLLHAGADLNDCGYENGIVWEDDDLLGQYNHLAGCSPLFICKELELIGFRDQVDDRKEDRSKIEELLVANGARSFKEDWARAMASEEEDEENELDSESRWGSSKSNTNNRGGSMVN